MSRPTVSVIIPTYNRAALLPRALDSIVAQTFSDWEIVLVDDGSVDDTPAVASRYAKQLGDRLLYLPQENRGSSAARNRGIDECHGRFVAFLDSDDEFVPTKLERQLSLFERRPDLGLVYSDFAFVDLDGIRHDSAFDAKFAIARTVSCREVAPRLCVCTDSLFDVLIRGYFIATIVGMVRREVLGGDIRFSRDHSYAEEWLFYLTVARRCKAGFVNEPLAVHHFVKASLARSNKQRNTARYHDLLATIERSFPGLTARQRGAVHRQLAQTSRQLGYDARSAGRRREAFAHFTESLEYECSISALLETVRLVGSVLPDLTAPRKAVPATGVPALPTTGVRPSQALSQAVR